jgi:rubrerythrin
MVICSCGCNQTIPNKTWHKYYEPKYIHGHSFKGKHFSEEHKEKIRLSNIGKNTGKTRSEETKKRMGETHKGYKMSNELKEKLKLSRLGSHHSIKARQQISNTLLKKQVFTEFGTKLNKAIRTSEQYKLWRNSIFEQNNYTCQKCGEKGCYIEAHHRIPLNTLIYINNIDSLDSALLCKDIWDINNGITYCEDCHASIDANRGKFYKRGD